MQLYACGNNDEVAQTNNSSTTDSTKMKITIGSAVFIATLDNNAITKDFKAMLPLTINMNELNGNEKFFDLLNDLPTNATKPATIQNGDLMLYGSKTLVLFYKTFSTSYSYTRIGRVENPLGLTAALGSGNATVTFETN